MAVQFTLADGFFNRKRGRPPKNRYVQVYKNLQLPPQAVFTSFKLERPHLTHATLSSLPVALKEIEKGEKTPMHTNRSEPIAQGGECSPETFFETNPDDNKEMQLQTKTVVRSTGIYYPDSTPRVQSMEKSMTVLNESLNTNKDLPEDLSPRSTNNKIKINSQVEFTYSYLQMLQLINMYHRIGLPLLRKSEAINLKTALAVEDDNSVHPDFSRYEYQLSQDCGFEFCRYRYIQTKHFHCIRSDCQNSFCEKSRFTQHAARHKRLDRLLGEDFKRYHPQMDCGYENCDSNKIVSKKPSHHFHCLRCAFSCRETYKLIPHRRWHRMLEFLQKTGFHKVLYSEQCNFGASAGLNTCSYSGKRTHYHCSACECCVLLRSQTFGHKHKSGTAA